MNPSSFTYNEYKPSAELSHIVKCYAEIRYTSESSKLYYDFQIPFGSPYIQVCYDGFLNSPEEPFNNVDSIYQHITGQIQQYFIIEHNGTSKHFAIIFQTCGLHGMLQCPMQLFTHKVYNIADVFGTDASRFVEQLKESKSVTERIMHAESLIKKNMRSVSYKNDGIDQAADYIRKQPTLSLDQICNSINTSGRQLRRKFNEKIGIGPKAYMRICRIHYLIKQSKKSGTKDIQELMYLGGFYDQSHLIQDFKIYTGKTPYEYFGKNNPNGEIGGILN